MRENGHERSHFEFADFRLYPNERLLINDQGRIALTPRVMDLLIVLVEREGELVRKDELLNLVWSESFVEEGNVSRTISTLRKNLGVQSNGSDFIETVPKIGYRFIAPVGRVRNDRPVVPSSSTISRSTLLLIGFLLTAAAVAGTVFYKGARLAKVPAAGDFTNLTNNIAEDEYPEWSPDGARIAFASNRDGVGDIYVMRADGSGVVRLTNTPARETAAVWSPDGNRIVFDSDRDGNRELYIMNADGSNQTRLTFNPTADAGPVSFSPDGSRMAYARNASSQGSGSYNYDIYTMNIDGSDVKRLTVDPEFDAEPLWSPDGKNILFTSGRDGQFKIYSINADGTGEVKLSTSDSSHEGVIAFTSDRRQVFCIGDTPDKLEFMQIYLMNADGTNRRLITAFTDKIFRVSYSPRTQKFAVSTERDGNHEIYSIDVGTVPAA